MIEAKFAFFQVKQELISSEPSQFSHPKLGITPERFNTVYVVFPARKFVFTVMDPMVLIAIGNKSIISLPAIGVHIRTLKYLAF